MTDRSQTHNIGERVMTNQTHQQEVPELVALRAALDFADQMLVALLAEPRSEAIRLNARRASLQARAALELQSLSPGGEEGVERAYAQGVRDAAELSRAHDGRGDTAKGILKLLDQPSLRKALNTGSADND